MHEPSHNVKETFLRTPGKKKRVKEEENEQESSKNGNYVQTALSSLERGNRQLKVPRPLGDDDKELFTILARDVFRVDDDRKNIVLQDVVGLVSKRKFMLGHKSNQYCCTTG